MNVHEAYEKLGLEPLDDFLIRNGPAETRGIGATTWMLVEASLALLDGKDVVLVGHNLAYADTLVRSCISFVDQLGAMMTSRSKSSARTVHFDGFIGDLRWESENTLQRSLRGRKDSLEVFSDQTWKLRAMDRMKGPFACIRLIRKVHDPKTLKMRFYAWDDRGEYLMELTEDGAFDIAAAEGMKVQCEGW